MSKRLVSQENSLKVKKLMEAIKKENIKTYRVEIKSLAYFDVEANSETEAFNLVPKSYSENIINSNSSGSIFYEEFDHKNATVIEQ